MLHTVALPEPSEVLTSRALATFRRLRDVVGPEAIEDSLEDEEEKVYDADHPPDTDDSFVGAAPPVDLLDADLDSVDALVEAVRRVPGRWRLDVLMALTDLNDEDDE
ncbi:hypothetical protein GXB85_17290 [Cellulomonas sp. APG4]|uniref:hypothetical protein n=1 Tax=Cellulomonas sp. APG4 TaxID=1538656 RepID=UPI00137A0BE1|nr:hypothetical protein [Cellulomonas sp. APG4]NCT92691.1 hypothetical protein [Cellulomonas sp. APG4]